MVLALAAVAAVAAAGGCKRRTSETAAPSVRVAALAAIPGDAVVVVGIDVHRLADSSLVARAVDQMLVRDPELSTRLAKLAKDCGVDITRQVSSVYLALGAKPPGAPAPSLLVATGQLAEASLTRCLQAGVGSGGADLSVKDTGGRSLYKLTEGSRVLFFGFGKADTVVIGPSESWVLSALGTGDKVDRSATLGPLLGKVDRKAAIWTTAVMDAELGASLAKITNGKVAHGPKALYGALDPADGLRAEVAFVMNDDGEAQALVDFAHSELAIGAIVAQAKGLGPLVAKVQIERKGAEARFRVKLTDDEVKDVLGAIDRSRPSGQDAPPAPDAAVPSP